MSRSSNDIEQWVSVRETSLFAEAAARLLTGAEHFDLITYIAKNPTVGDVIPDTSGLRKLRWGAKGRGKRGGVRVIYFYCNGTQPIYLLDVYAKSVKEDLSPAAKQKFRAFAELLKARG